MKRIKRQKKLSKSQEKKAAADLGGTTVPASGALPTSKGDVRVVGKYTVECKYTEADSYTLKLMELLKIRMEATRQGEDPIFQVEFKKNNKARYAIVPTKLDPTVTTYGKNIVLRSSDLFFGMKNSPILVIRFDRVPMIGFYTVAIYEWNSFLEMEKNNVGD